MFIVARDNEHNRKINQATYTDVQNMRKAEDAKLSGYQHLDKDKGTVRIPVERAMQLMAEEAKGAAPTAVKPEAKPAAAVPPPPAKAVAAGPKK